MVSPERLRADLDAALIGPGGAIESADRLCHACVELLEVDGAAISLVQSGAVQGTFGSSGELSRRLDELQFTLGEGPCLDAVSGRRPVVVSDLTALDERRWPAFSEAVVKAGVRAVMALPITVAASPVGALDLFRNTSGTFSEGDIGGATWAAEIAALPLLDMLSENVDHDLVGDRDDGWAHLASLERVEVYQATGMIMAQLDVGPAEALIRLRAHAFANDLTASEVAWSIIERRVRLDNDDSWGDLGAGSPS